ncbi:hypothetical protein P3S68_003580 [Capsicum galapagoense]
MDGYTNVQKVVSKYWRSCFGCTSRCLVIQMTVTSDLMCLEGNLNWGKAEGKISCLFYNSSRWCQMSAICVNPLLWSSIM